MRLSRGQTRAQASLYGTSACPLGHGQLWKDTKKNDGVNELALSKRKVTGSLKMVMGSICWFCLPGTASALPVLIEPSRRDLVNVL